MSIIVGTDTNLVVSGLTGREGSFHGLRNRDYGTELVAGVTPGKGGQDVDGVPVFDTVAEAVEKTGANTSMVFVPARFAADAILESHDAGIKVIVAITENIPAMDMARTVPYVRGSGNDVALIGPNCPGLISPGKANVGIIPGEICSPGPVGLVSRSGTLTYQIIHELTHNHLFVPGQVTFNESFANFSGRVGAVRFFCTRPGSGADSVKCARAQARWRDEVRFSRFLDGFLDVAWIPCHPHGERAHIRRDLLQEPPIRLAVAGLCPRHEDGPVGVRDADPPLLQSNLKLAELPIGGPRRLHNGQGRDATAPFRGHSHNSTLRNWCHSHTLAAAGISTKRETLRSGSVPNPRHFPVACNRLSICSESS